MVQQVVLSQIMPPDLIFTVAKPLERPQRVEPGQRRDRDEPAKADQQRHA
jgi:hypothetical protein